MKTFRTHYDNLKVARDAPDIVIRAAYKSLSQRFHPDKNLGDERAARVMSIINQSYEVLSDPAKRSEHDAWIAREESKLSNEVKQAQGAPIPPQWKAPPAPPQAKSANSNMLVNLLLWPLKVLLRIFAAAPQLVVLGLLIGGIALYDAVTPDRPPPPGPKPYNPTPAPPSAPEPVKYTKPQVAPNGEPWPTFAAYVAGYERLNTRGLSSVTIDNTQNDSDVFVKLVSLAGVEAYPVRQVFIPAHGTFTAKKIDAGDYDIRYRDLDTGGLSRSDAFTLKETPMDGGIQYSTMTMTLYKVQDGNMQTFPLAEAEF